MSLKELGCALSHAHALLQGLEATSQSNGSFVVFEDDVFVPSMVSTSVRQYVLTAMNEAPEDFDVMFLGWCMEACSAAAQISAHLQTAVGPLCAHAYIVSAAGARKLLKRMLPASEPNDVVLRKMLVSGELRGFKTKHVLFEQTKNTYIAAHDNNTAMKRIEASRNVSDVLGGTSVWGSSLHNPPTLLCHLQDDDASGLQDILSRLIDDVRRHRVSALSWLLTFGSNKQLQEVAQLGVNSLLPEATRYSEADATFLKNCVGNKEPHMGSHGYSEWLLGFPECWVNMHEGLLHNGSNWTRSLKVLRVMQNGLHSQEFIDTVKLHDDAVRLPT